MKKLFYHTPLVLLLVFLSVEGFGQTDTTKKKSVSPILDKYYTRPKEDTVAAKPVIKSTGVQQRTVQTPAPVKQIPIEEKRLEFPAPARPATAIASKPAVKPADSIVPTIAAAPELIETPKVPSLLQSPIVEDTKIASAITDTSRIIRPVLTSTVVAPPKKPAPRPEGSLLRTRLGSSSPLYNTYEKNNNGAGSVTTLPKR